MFEKVNPDHPDKISDRIAGAIVDLAYKKSIRPKIAVEVLIGHNQCTVIIESSLDFMFEEIKPIVKRIAGENVMLNLQDCRQDIHLATNQAHGEPRCGDNGIFKGVPVTKEQKMLAMYAQQIFEKYPTDGKYILDLADSKMIICQSCATEEELREMHPKAIINPLGYWKGGINVDTGATNRKLGSDMGDAVTGGGLHGKDLSKADVSVNIYAHIKAQHTGEVVNLCCAIGDTMVDGRPYSEIVDIAQNYIAELGGFEKLAEWGLIR